MITRLHGAADWYNSCDTSDTKAAAKAKYIFLSKNHIYTLGVKICFFINVAFMVAFVSFVSHQLGWWGASCTLILLDIEHLWISRRKSYREKIEKPYLYQAGIDMVFWHKKYPDKL